MLTLTPEAVEAVDTLLHCDEKIPQAAGLRLGAKDDQDIAVALTLSPADEDQVIEDAGARVFVAPEIATMVDDAVLHAEEQGGRFAFGLVPKR
ncbi:MAG: iron-sulfur cluster assembly protein [Solirubrobacteraceae bacterium]|jgi:iron-sulfur cluster assembly protein|nr:iron-sulfur cluster assembly protein [Solirubrobacteraceae bacterium]